MQPHLWRVMDSVGGREDDLRAIARIATEEQLILLNRRFNVATAELRNTPGFRSEPGKEEALARWVVSRGQRAWRAARDDPRSLPAAPPAGAADFGKVLDEVYRERFSRVMPEQEPEPAAWRDLPVDPSWEERLWEVTDVVNLGVPLSEAVAGFTRSELIQLENARSALAERLEDQLYQSDRGASGRDWGAIASWTIGRGKAATEQLLAHPETAPMAFPDDEPWLSDLLEDVYQQRYSERWPMIKYAG